MNTVEKGRLLTLHSYSSDGIGGIETLIRSIQKVAFRLGLESIEIYARSGITNLFENETPQAKKIKLQDFLGGGIKKRVFRYLLWRKEINNKINKNDIVVLFSVGSLLYFTRKKLSEANVIFVQTNKYEKIFNSLSKQVVFSLYRKYIDKVTVYTEYDKNKFSSIFNDIEVIPRGCKIETSGNVSEYTHKLVTIARIDEAQKNLSEMIDIVSGLPESYELTIYGSGEKEEVENLNKLIGGNKRIKFKGPIKEVKKALNENSVFLMTSHYEGFGQTLIEARSQGLPIVAYDTFEAAKWIIRHGLNGYLIEPYNKDLFREAILKITKNENVFVQYSRNALSFAEETENEKVEAQWEKLIESYS